MCNAVVHPITKETITKYKKLANDPVTAKVWKNAFCHELGRLSQGYDTTKGTNTIRFMKHDAIRNIPKDRTVTYARIVVDYRPQKADPNRVRITAGGNLIEYPDELTTRTADLITTKIMWNSVISTPGAKYKCIDIKNIYLATPMDRFEYMRIPIDLIPEEFIKKYNLLPLVKNGYVYTQIERGMYGLPQAGILANKLLKKRLEPYGYYEVQHTPGLFRHKTRPIQFTLVVDDFGVKFTNKNDMSHLIDALEEHYEISIDHTGSLYCGITLFWNYKEGYLEISMPGYVRKKLLEYKHLKPRRRQDCPLAPAPRSFGKNSQRPAEADNSPLLHADEKKYIERVIGSFLFYGRAVEEGPSVFTIGHIFIGVLFLVFLVWEI